MVVCSCNMLTDYVVHAALSMASAPRTISQVYRHLGHEPHCGRCAHSIRDLMRMAQRCQPQETNQ
jgi:bacterioferritin-associated ferredoxin